MPFDARYPPDTSERVEGLPFYDLTEYVLAPPDGDETFRFFVRAFRELPFSDAVGLLSGDDQTGLIVWSGALAMIEWLVRGSPCRLTTALTSTGEDPVLCVELGCGCGAVTVALAQYLHAHSFVPSAGAAAPVKHIQFLCTDGNESCVALAQANTDAFCSRPTHASSHALCVECAADVLLWGQEGVNSGYDALLRRHGVLPGAWNGTLFILSADILYSTEAVPLLVSTVRSLHSILHPRGGTTWWILYIPRSLTQSTNLALFAHLVTLLHAQPGWTITRHPLPSDSVVTGFESRVEAAAVAESGDDLTPHALLGCVLEVHLPTP